MATNENPAGGNGRVSKINAGGPIHCHGSRFDRSALLARRAASRALDRLLNPDRFPDLDITCPPVSLREVA